MTSQHELAVTAAWSNLEKWVSDEIKAAREEVGVAKVIPDRSAETLVQGLLRNADVAIDAGLADAIGVDAVTRFTSTPVFWRVRTVFPMASSALDIDVLRQIAWGSELRKPLVTDWVDEAIRAEVGLVLRALEVDAEPLDPGDGATVDTIEVERVVEGSVMHQHVEKTHRENVRPRHVIDEATLERLSDRLESGGRPLWLVCGDDPRRFDKAERNALKEHVASWAPAGMLDARGVVAMCPGLLDIVFLRASDLAPGWDHAVIGGVDLVLEELVAIEVIHKPRAVSFRRPD